MINDKKIKNIQKILKYKFINIENLQNSLTHPSTFKNNKSLKDKSINEFDRLEFLGDRVLGLIVASLIFKQFKNYNEGYLSKNGLHCRYRN